MLMRDADIRQPLQRWLTHEHQNDPDAVVLHEVKIPRPSARIDMAAVNGQLCGYEIKSDVDTLVRLAHQSKSFNVIFDTVNIVTTVRHLKAAKDMVPKWWGIILMEADGLVEVRTAQANQFVDAIARLHMLDRSELFELGTRIGCPGIASRSKRATLVESITQAATGDSIALHVRSLLKRRAQKNQRSVAGSSSSISSATAEESCL
jgi:hypothetical protein